MSNELDVVLFIIFNYMLRVRVYLSNVVLNFKYGKDVVMDDRVMLF